MHAVVVRVNIGDPGTAEQGLREEVVPRVSKAPGFVAGYWTRSDDGTNGVSMLVFDSEEAARQSAEFLQGTDAIRPETVTLESVEVREVLANA